MKTKNGLRAYADGGLAPDNTLRDVIKRRMAEIDNAGSAPKPATPTAPTAVKPAAPAAPAASTQQVLSDAAAKAARFKFERENPGVPYVPGKADGGMVQGPGGPTEDRVTVRMSPGEFVLPADTVKAVGVNKLHAMVKATHTPVKAKGLANGGMYIDVIGDDTMAPPKRDPFTLNPDGTQTPRQASFEAAQARDAARAAPPAPAAPGSTSWVDRMRRPVGLPDLRTFPGAGAVRSVTRGVARSLPVIGTGLEAVDAAGDMSRTQDTGERIARGGESAAKLALGSLGAVAGSALGPAGTIAGGALGYKAPELVEKGVRALGGPAFLPSTLINERAAANAAPAQPTAPAQPAVDPAVLAQQKADALATATTQAGQSYPDQTSRVAQQQGVRTAISPPGFQPPAPGTDASQIKVGDKEGYLTGRDASGMQRTIHAYNGMDTPNVSTVSSNALGAAMGMRADHSAPTSLAQADNNLRSALSDAAGGAYGPERAQAAQAQLAALSQQDAAKAAADKARDDATARKQTDADLRTAQQDQQIALRNKDPDAYKAASQRLAGAQATQLGYNALDKEGVKAASDRYTADTGLRAHMYTANADLQGHELTANATLGAAALKSQYDMWKQQLDLNKDNREEYGKLMTNEFSKTVTDDKGKSSIAADPEAQQNFEKWVTAKAVNDPKFLKTMKVNSLDELTATQWRPLVQDYKKSMGLASATGDTTRGMPTRASLRDYNWQDMFPNSPQNPVESRLGAMDYLKQRLNPLTANTMNEKVVTVGFKDGKPVEVPGTALASNPELVTQAIAHMRSQGQNKEADELDKRFNTTKRVFGK